MIRSVKLIVVLLAVILPRSSAAARAQDFEVYTRVYDENAVAADGKSPLKVPIARSLTMFHAGKAYDYIEAIGEVVVIDFDPATPHFSLLKRAASWRPACISKKSKTCCRLPRRWATNR